MATGRRPITSYAALLALGLVKGDREVILAHHDATMPSMIADSVAAQTVWLPGAPKARCLNTTLARYVERHGDWPRCWITMDDDAIVDPGTFDIMEELLQTFTSIGLLGLDNTAREQGRGSVRLVHLDRPYLVQFGVDFCVGGIVHAIPYRTLRALDGPYRDIDRHEDHGLTWDVRALGMDAVILLDRWAVHLPDDGVDATYRDEIARRDQAERARLGL